MEDKRLESILKEPDQKFDCPICGRCTSGVLSSDLLLPPAILCDYCGAELIISVGPYFESDHEPE